MELNFDRNKYLEIAKAQGYSAAVTALHRDFVNFEFKTFEGPDGYNPAAWAEMAEVRAFSRELWEMALRDPSASN